MVNGQWTMDNEQLKITNKGKKTSGEIREYPLNQCYPCSKKILGISKQ
jgi:hypothetical protein